MRPMGGRGQWTLGLEDQGQGGQVGKQGSCLEFIL